MLHELSHIRSMTHGPLFWKTYHILKKDMAELDAKGYTGEGFYSRPCTLDGSVHITRSIAEDEIPENICGGSWKRETRRRRRRKTGRRKKKFKGEGVKIGEDEMKRMTLEGGKVGKRSRVAKSKRARDLRAEAALRRFAQQGPKKEDSNEDVESDSSTESEEEVEEVVR